MDISGSLEGNYDIITTFIKEITEGVNFMFARARISYTVFAADPFTRFYFNTFTTKRDVINALKITEVGYQTDLAKALKEITDNVMQPYNGDRDFVDNKVIVVTDGKSTLGSENLNNEIYRLKQKGTVYAVAVGESINPNVMRSLASKPESDFYHRIYKYDNVVEKANDVLATLCN